MNPDDIFLWPDGFWCLRQEHSEQFLRDDSYRVIPHLTDEWRKVEKLPPIAPTVLKE